MKRWIILVVICVLAVGFTAAWGISHQGERVAVGVHDCPGGQQPTSEPCPPDPANAWSA